LQIWSGKPSTGGRPHGNTGYPVPYLRDSLELAPLPRLAVLFISSSLVALPFPLIVCATKNGETGGAARAREAQ
jgi:hypothetical protein